MAYNRSYANSVILADGKVIVLGGQVSFTSISRDCEAAISSLRGSARWRVGPAGSAMSRHSRANNTCGISMLDLNSLGSGFIRGSGSVLIALCKHSLSLHMTCAGTGRRG